MKHGQREERKVTVPRDSNTRWPQAQIKNSADRSFTLALGFFFSVICILVYFHGHWEVGKGPDCSEGRTF